ncbi:LysM peptidoglycan-binding domain-containing protein [Nitratifractor sp.]
MKKYLSIASAIILSLSALSAAPSTSASARQASNFETVEYTVQSGDSLYSIARKHHTTIRALRDANGISEGAILRPGQALKVPAVAKKITSKGKRAKKRTAKTSRKSVATKRGSKPPKPRIYKVEAGDSPSIIAQRFGISTKDLLDANEMKRGDLIKVGQVLKIPGGTKAKAEKTASTPAKKSVKEKPAKAGERPRPVAGGKIYTVESGDTLFSIARKYKIPLNDLMSINGIKPTDVIKPGQVLKIPSKTYAVKSKAKKTAKKVKEAKKTKKQSAVYHTVKHGDVLWRIAKKYGVTVREIRKLNKLSRRSVIHSGQKLLIKPGSEAKVAQAKPVKKKQPRYYTVKRGDSLWKIAKEHKVSVAELRRYNKMTSGSLLHLGMKVIVGYDEVSTAKVAKKKIEKKKKPAQVAKKKTRTKKVQKKVKVVGKSKKSRRSANRRISSAMSVLNGKGSGGSYSSRAGQDIIRTAKRYLGRRYVWGAEGPSSFDCSGFTQYVLRKSKGVKLPRVSRKQAYYGKYVTRSQLRPGDLIFFDTSRRRRGYVNHVGIYIGNGKFIHASSARHRVVITSLNSPFYRARFKWGRRVN